MIAYGYLVGLFMEIEKMIADISIIYLLLHNTKQEMVDNRCDLISLADNKINFYVNYKRVVYVFLLDNWYYLEINVSIKNILVCKYVYNYNRADNELLDIVDNQYEFDSLANYNNALNYLKKSRQQKRYIIKLNNGIPDWVKDEIKSYYNQLIYFLKNGDDSRKIKELTVDASKGGYYEC